MHLKQKRAGAIERLGPERYMECVLPHVDARTSVGVAGSGEPLESPHFDYVFDALASAGARIHVPTNLHRWTVLADALNRYDNVGIVTSYHLGAFLDHGLARRERWWEGFSAIDAKHFGPVVVPLTPGVLADKNFENECDRIKARGVGLHLLELVHKMHGKRYPESYTEDEWKRAWHLMEKYDSKRARTKSLDGLKAVPRKLQLEGKVCHVFKRRITVKYRGEILHCVKKSKLGIIGEYDGPWWGKAKACPFEVCKCRPLAVRHCLKPNGIPLERFAIEDEGDEG
jgi:hypothetical protein